MSGLFEKALFQYIVKYAKDIKRKDIDVPRNPAPLTWELGPVILDRAGYNNIDRALGQKIHL
jgi:hypothetical protein